MKTILVDAVNTFVKKKDDGSFGIFEELHKLLKSYPNKKIILTNANNEQIEKFGLNNMPYEVFTLKHDPDKQNQEYFKKMLRQFNLKQEEVIYFEHNEQAVKSAESTGIKTYHYNKDAKDLDALKKFIDKNLQ